MHTSQSLRYQVTPSDHLILQGISIFRSQTRSQSLRYQVTPSDFGCRIDPKAYPYIESQSLRYQVTPSDTSCYPRSGLSLHSVAIPSLSGHSFGWLWERTLITKLKSRNPFVIRSLLRIVRSGLTKGRMNKSVAIPSLSGHSFGCLPQPQMVC